MPRHDPTSRPTMTAAEASAVRRWTLGTLVAATVAIVASPFTGVETDRMAAIAMAATFATGAVMVRRPTGFRAILAGAGVASVAAAFLA